jgi:hypothetical protein
VRTPRGRAAPRQQRRKSRSPPAGSFAQPLTLAPAPHARPAAPQLHCRPRRRRDERLQGEQRLPQPAGKAAPEPVPRLPLTPHAAPSAPARSQQLIAHGALKHGERTLRSQVVFSREWGSSDDRIRLVRPLFGPSRPATCRARNAPVAEDAYAPRIAPRGLRAAVAHGRCGCRRAAAAHSAVLFPLWSPLAPTAPQAPRLTRQPRATRRSSWRARPGVSAWQRCCVERTAQL